VCARVCGGGGVCGCIINIFMKEGRYCLALVKRYYYSTEKRLFVLGLPLTISNNETPKLLGTTCPRIHSKSVIKNNHDNKC